MTCNKVQNIRTVLEELKVEEEVIQILIGKYYLFLVSYSLETLMKHPKIKFSKYFLYYLCYFKEILF